MKDLQLKCHITRHNELRRTLLKVQGTNVAVPIPQDLFTEDEETEDEDVPPTETTVTPEVKGGQETLSPTPQVLQTVQSAIEVTVKDFEPSEQCIVDKCSEVDFQLSSH